MSTRARLLLARRSRRFGVALSTAVTLFATVARAETAPILERAYAAKAAGRLADAREAFEDAARLEGPTGHVARLELGYLAAAAGDLASARREYQFLATLEDDPELARRARAELNAITAPPPPPASAPPPSVTPVVSSARTAAAALDEAYRAKAAGDFPRATRAFEDAIARGADRQRISMELGYLDAASGDPAAAHEHFRAAERGADVALGEAARRERKNLPRRLYADGYADGFGWNRMTTTAVKGTIVPTLRLRAFFRPALAIPFDVYLAAQATRDTGSHGYVGSALPQLFSDNYAIAAGGARVRFWGGRIETFAQVGQAFNLIPNDGRARTALDVRGGVVLYAETALCSPPRERTRFGFWPCLEGYGEAVYVNRFRNDVIGFARPRVAAGYLETGPVLWQGVVETRAGQDVNRDYWNNFVDGGLGQRWRLLTPFRLDLLVSANVGTYFAGAGAPSVLTYVDGRALATTYVVF